MAAWHPWQAYDELTTLVARFKNFVEGGFAELLTPELEATTQAVLNRAHATKLEARPAARQAAMAGGWRLAHVT